MHGRLIPGQWPLVLHLTEAHQQLLKLLGTPDEPPFRIPPAIFTNI
jgi:hypothetical protein